MILDKFPTTEEFYKTYWGQKPFVVRGAIDKSVFPSLIDGDTLAGLSLEKDIKSRIIITESEDNKWTCHHGPFDEDKFSTLGEKNWSLLVQNVDQYHPATTKLLQHFHFSPRWLMDDIMVSYSTVGGSVGPHTDSYHVFLVQGIGRRKWKISRDIVENKESIEGLGLKVMKDGFEGEEVETSIGDLIYLPPHFAHEGITTEEAMTFSVGFLGLKFSEMLVEYGSYLERQESQDKRYYAQGIDARSAAFSIDPTAQKNLQNDLGELIKSDDFLTWLAEYFSTPTHDDVENIENREPLIPAAEIFNRLKAGENLYRPESVKLSITTASDGSLNLAVHGSIVPTSSKHNKFIGYLNQNKLISIENLETEAGKDREELLTLLVDLYNRQALFFENDALI